MLRGLLDAVRGRVRGSVGVVVGLGGFSPEYPAASFGDYVEWYRRDPVVRSAADFLAEAVAGMGGYTSSSDGEAKRVVDEFNEEVNLDEVHLQAAKWALMCGSFFLERVYSEYDFEVVDGAGGRVEVAVPAEGSEFIGLKPIPITSIQSVQRDRFGRVLWFNQSRGGVMQRLSPKVVVHYAWNIVDCEPFGSGWLTPLLSSGRGYRVDGKTRFRPSLLELKERLDDAAGRLCLRYVPRHVYNFPGKGDEWVKSLAKELSRLEPEQDFVTNVEGFDVKEVSVGSRASLEFLWRYIWEQIVIGTQTHHIRLFTTPGFTEASAKEATAAMERKLNAARRFIKRVTEREIFKPLLESRGFEGSEVRWNWGVVEKPKLEIQHLIEFSKLAAQGYPVLSVEEVRSMLKDFGFKVEAAA
ncbi:MAG: hypothetical protein QXJ86_05690 [Nitrososphaerales archaeon]